MAFVGVRQQQGFELAYLPVRHASLLNQIEVLDPPRKLLRDGNFSSRKSTPELFLRPRTRAQPDDLFAEMNIEIVANDLPASGWARDSFCLT
jgi:hypothetical protein